MGWDSEGIPYTRDQAITLDKVHEKLQEAGHNIPKARIFNCTRLKDRKVPYEHFKTCTGRNYVIFKAVWEHEGIGDIVKRFYKEYNEFNNTRAPGEEFHAAFLLQKRLPPVSRNRSWLAVLATEPKPSY